MAGLGQALDQLSDALPFIQGRNEQALVHMGHRLRQGDPAPRHPGRHRLHRSGRDEHGHRGRLATVNRLPVLLLPGDTYATRRQGPVLQQLQHPVEADATVNDAFRPVSRFFDRITRPEQLLTALPAMRVLTDPVDTGAVVCRCPRTSSRTPTTSRPSCSTSGTG